MNSNASFAAPIVQPLIDRGVIAGAVVLAADRQGVRAVETLGYADLEARRPMTDDAMFWIASTSKAVTGTLVAMLIEEGKLHPDDPVEKHLPEFKGQWVLAEHSDERLVLKKPAHPVTLIETLTHTSGLPFRTPNEVPTLDGLPLAAAVRGYAMMPLLTEPGTQYAYSNAGTNTAARLIEVVTGQGFDEFLHERLLDPLGMRDTTFWPDEAQTARIAEVYRLAGTDEAPGALEKIANEQVSFPLSDRVRRFGFPAGGLYSTAGDVAKFGRMVANLGTLDGRHYLSEATVREMTSRHTPAHTAEARGYLWDCNEGLWGHGGAYRNAFLIDPKTGVTFVFMVQSAGPTGGAQVGEAIKACRQAAFERFGG